MTDTLPLAKTEDVGIEKAGEHTPTPWCSAKEHSNTIIIRHDPKNEFAEGSEVCSLYNEGRSVTNRMKADADLIVRAVNSHDDLVKALVIAREYVQGRAMRASYEANARYADFQKDLEMIHAYPVDTYSA
jgi:hypothetical protein